MYDIQQSSGAIVWLCVVFKYCAFTVLLTSQFDTRVPRCRCHRHRTYVGVTKKVRETFCWLRESVANSPAFRFIRAHTPNGNIYYINVVIAPSASYSQLELSGVGKTWMCAQPLFELSRYSRFDWREQNGIERTQKLNEKQRKNTFFLAFPTNSIARKTKRISFCFVNWNSLHRVVFVDLKSDFRFSFFFLFFEFHILSVAPTLR